MLTCRANNIENTLFSDGNGKGNGRNGSKGNGLGCGFRTDGTKTFSYLFQEGEAVAMDVYRYCGRFGCPYGTYTGNGLSPIEEVSIC